MRTFFVVIVWVLAGLSRTEAWDSSILYHDTNGRLVYTSDGKGNRLVDFSHAGYRSGEAAFPEPAVVLEIDPVEGDDTAHIQAAINTVGALAPDVNGHRGALLLRKGIYEVSGILYMNQSGVVLRGEGNGNTANDTRVIGTGTAQRKEQGIILVNGAGGSNVEPGTTQNVVSEFLPMGARTIEVENGAMYAVGDHLVVRHDPTEAWLEAINYGNVDGDENVWVAGQNDLKMYFHGTVTAIVGNQIKFDTPLYHPLDASLSRAVVYRHNGAGLVRECGVENMRVISENAGGTDESHRWDCVHFINAENCWARNVISEGFAESGFRFTRSRRSTVANCQAINPVSKIEGGRRYNFYVGEYSNDVLFKNCLATRGRHCFVGNGAASVSGAVFSQCESRETYSSSENHRRWGSGFLWDDIEWNNAVASTILGMHNRGNSGTSHGWTGTGLVAWNANAPGKYIICSEPPVGQNFAIGCDANVTGGYYPRGFTEGTGQTPAISSLYEAQLAERLTHGVGPDAPARLEVTHYENSVAPFAALRWDDLALDETAYVVERSANGGNSFVVVAVLPANTTSHTDATVAQNGAYVYRVKTTNAVGSSAYGNVASVDLATDELLAAVVYQAEDFVAGSGASVRWDRHGFTSSGYVDINGTSTWIELDVDGGMGGPTPILFRFGAGETYDRPCAISVNGTQVATSRFTSPGSWDAWNTETISIPLERGVNRLRIQPNGSVNGPNLDKIEVRAVPTEYAAGKTSAETGATAAFDGDAGTVWKHESPLGSWVQRSFAGALEVVEYSITSSFGPMAHDPAAWVFKGSNDGGASWTALDQRSGQTFPSRGQTRSFSVNPSGDYSLYRLEITAVRDPATAVAVELAELAFVYGALPAPTPNPAGFAVAPHPVSESAISMTAHTGASSIGPVEYYFNEISGASGGTDSGWISSPTYTDSGLTAGVEYRYTVTLRDVPGNETAASSPASAQPYKLTTTTWKPAAASDGLWRTGSNWTGGAPLSASQYKKVVFNVGGAKECVLDVPAVIAQLVIGDNGTYSGNAVRLSAGGDLLAGYKPGANAEWSAVGYNRSATLVVESGARFETAAHLLIGLAEPAAGVLRIQGGEVIVATHAQLGNTAGTSTGEIVVEQGGVLRAAELRVRYDSSRVDVRDGVIILDGDQVSAVNGLSAAGRLLAFGGDGSLLVDYDVTHAGKTTITAGRPIPNLAGMTLIEAEAALKNMGFVVGEVVTVSSETIPAGELIAQDPVAATTALPGDRVDLTVSLGPYVAESVTRWRASNSAEWTAAANWSGGAAPTRKASHLKVVFDGDTTVPAVLSGPAEVAHLVVGDNGPAVRNALTLASGADLFAGARPDNSTVWAGVGFNRPAKVVVRAGAKFATASHLWVGHFEPAEGVLIVEGGQIEVGGTLGVGYNGGTGALHIRAGEVHARGFDSTRSIGSNATINIESGSLTITGDRRTVVNNYIAAGRLTAYEGLSTVIVAYDGETDETSITAEPYGFDEWASDWGVNIQGREHDADGDGLSNFHEYVLDGDPVDATNTGAEPELISRNGKLFYAHPLRADDPLLRYRVEVRSDLMEGEWADAGELAVGTNTLFGGDFHWVTNEIPTNLESEYIRLKVERRE